MSERKSEDAVTVAVIVVVVLLILVGLGGFMTFTIRKQSSVEAQARIVAMEARERSLQASMAAATPPTTAPIPANEVLIKEGGEVWLYVARSEGGLPRKVAIGVGCPVPDLDSLFDTDASQIWLMTASGRVILELAQGISTSGIAAEIVEGRETIASILQRFLGRRRLEEVFAR